MPAKPPAKPGGKKPGAPEPNEGKGGDEKGDAKNGKPVTDEAAQKAIQAANAASQAAAAASKAASEAAAAAEKAAQLAQETAKTVEGVQDGGAEDEPLPEGVKSPAELEAERHARAAAQLRAIGSFPAYLKLAGKKSDVRSATRAQREAEAYTCSFLKQDGNEDVLKAVVERLMELYDRQPGTVVDEMLERLSFPEGDGGGEEVEPGTSLPRSWFDNEAKLALLAAGVQKQTGRHSIENPLAQLLLRQSTQCGADVDRDLGFDDAPPLRKRMDLRDQIEEWDEYRDEHGGSGGRNAPIAPRLRLVARDTPPEPLPEKEKPAAPDAGGDTKDTKDEAKPKPPKPADKDKDKEKDKSKDKDDGKNDAPADGAVQYYDTGDGWDKWLKWGCSVWALTPKTAEHPVTGRHAAPSLYYSVGGGWLSKEVVDQHRALTPGDYILWDGPRCGTASKRVAAETARGSGAGGGGGPTEEHPGSLIFTIKKAAHLGLPLGPLSNYPDEHGVLIPPFTKFKVVGNHIDAGNPHGEGLLLELEPEPLDVDGLDAFLRRVRRDIDAAAERLHVGQKRRIDGPAGDNTFTYAEKTVAPGGPKHVSLPLDTAWQEMLWVVDRAAGVADDAAKWSGREALATRPGLRDPSYLGTKPGIPQPKWVPKPEPLRPAFSPPPPRAEPPRAAARPPSPLGPQQAPTGQRRGSSPGQPKPPGVRMTPPQYPHHQPPGRRQEPPRPAYTPAAAPRPGSPSPYSPGPPPAAPRHGYLDQRAQNQPSMVSSMPGPPGSPNSFFNPASRPGERGGSPQAGPPRRPGGFPQHTPSAYYKQQGSHQPPSPAMPPRQPHSARWVHPSAYTSNNTALPPRHGGGNTGVI